jgi:hypothetical protein
MDIPDIIGSLDIGGGLNWYRNLGTFGFGPAQPLAGLVTATQITSGDLDGDGDQDVIAALDDNTIQCTMNQNGLGQFGPLNLIAYTNDLVDLQVIDIDQDGDLDLSWSSSATEGSYYADNMDGLGGFAAPALLSGAGHGMQADQDGDGVLDLVLVNSATQQAVWQRRDMNAINYAPEALISSIMSPGPVLSADLDGDGDRDVVASSLATDEIFWYENVDGLGDFGPQQIIGSGVDDPMFLVAGDLNGDGDQEIFSAIASQQKVVRYDNLAGASDMIVGRVFNDIDGNGLFDGVDHGLYNIRVDLAGYGSTFTNHAGIYWFSVPPGSYTVQVPAVPGWQNTTPDTRAINLASPNNGAHGNDFGLQASSVDHDFQTVLSNSVTRCGMAISYWITANNIGNQVDDLDLTLDLDGLSTFIWSDPPPATNVGGVQTWNFNDVAPTHHREVYVSVMMPDASHMGETLHDALTLQAYQSDHRPIPGTARTTSC